MSNRENKSESLLRIGDEIFFYDQNSNKLIAENPLDTRACVRPSIHYLSSDVAMGTSIFRLEPQQSQSAQRELDLFIGDDRDIETIICQGTPEELKELQALQYKASKEISQNETERRRLLGKPVLYGQVIQLYNQHFKKYLTVTGKTRVTGKTHLLQVNLSTESIGYFRIMPRYRIRFVGDMIRVGETVALQCVRPEGYLNVDYNITSNQTLLHHDYYEVYSHTRISSWTMKLHYSSISDQDTKNVKYTNSGQYVRFYHKEMESYLEAPAIVHGNQVVLKKHIINPLDPKETDSPLAFWEIENVDISRGSKVRWKKSIRIRHVASRTYLSIDPSRVSIDIATGKTTFTLSLVKNPSSFMDSSQDTTLFQLIPVSAPSISGIPYGSFVRIQHVLTNCWMHSANGEEDIMQPFETISTAIPVIPQTLSPFTKLRRESLPQLSIHGERNHSRFSSFSTIIEDEPEKPDLDDIDNQYRITASQELYYHDCFSITNVEQELSDTFNVANEMLPYLQWYLHQDRFIEKENMYPIPDPEYESIINILKSLINFCTTSKENDITKRKGIPNEYHQILLREIGIIESVIQMILVPFDLTMRTKVRAQLIKTNKYSKSKKRDDQEEAQVTVMDNKLCSIITLCYHLLRLFLVERSSLEEPNPVSQENRQHVLSIASESGLEQFKQHLNYNVGATDVLIKLLDENESVAFIDDLISTALMETQEIVNSVSENLRSIAEKQNVSCFRLLCALTDNPHISRTITQRLFNPSSQDCLIQSRLTDNNQVEIKLRNDCWRRLGTFLGFPSSSLWMDYVLKLMYTLCNKTHTNTIEFIKQCISSQICFYCMKSANVSTKIRSRFCDLLRVAYVDIPDFKSISLSDYTIDFGILPFTDVKYPCGSVTIYSDYFKKVMRWILQYLDTRQNYVEDIDQVRFLRCVLKLVDSQLRLGFFTEPRDIDLLFRALVRVLDGRTDARNELHLEYILNENNPRPWQERYLLTEENQRIMNTKVQILNIFDLLFDLRLRVRVNYLANQWYSSTQDSNCSKHFELSSLLTTFQQTEIRHREHSLIPILKDILKYQYAPLKQIAVVVMHRLFNDSQELFKKISQVVVFDSISTTHGLVYQAMIENLERLKPYIFLDQSSPQHLTQIRIILKDLQYLLAGHLSLNDKQVLQDSSLFCRVFKSLDGSNMMIQLLKSLLNIPAKHYHEYIETIQVCLQMLCIVTTNDKEFQTQFILENMDLLIDITLLSSKLAVLFARLFSNNLYISTNIKEEHIERIVSTSEGYQADYLIVLHELLQSQGKLIKKNQDIVMRFIMENRTEYIPFNNTRMIETIHKMNEESTKYCINLIGILAICGQGENTFGQSFARTIFSIGDIYEVIQHKDISLPLKSVMLKFLASIYIEDLELPLDIPINDGHNMLQLIKISESAIMECLNGTDISISFQDYVYHGISAFLRSIFEYHVSIETIVADIGKTELYTRLVDLMLQLLPKTYQDEKALQDVLACLDSMINVAGFRGTMDPTILHALIKEATETLDALYERSHHHETRMSNISPEDGIVPIKDKINVEFQSYFSKIQMNTELAQYQKIEFEKLCSHFSLHFEGGRESIQSLISYLDTITTAKVDERVEYYQIASIQLLEDISMQYIRERAEIDPYSNAARYDELERKKSDAQNILNDLGCTLVVQNLLSSPRPKIFDAALKLLISLLEGGNKNVQDKLEEYFYSVREERFFYSFHQRLQDGMNASKEAQIYLTRKMYKMNRQQYMLDNIILSQESNQKRKVQQHRRSKSIMVSSSEDTSLSDKRNSQVLMMTNSRPQSIQPLKVHPPMTEKSIKLYQEISQFMVTHHEPTFEFGNTTKDFKVMEDTMRTLQLMVEGHNLHLQTYLAKQPDNIKSFNIVLDVIDYFHAIVPLCNASNIELIIQVLDTITELAQGCLENQVTIFNNKVINPVNLILRETYPDCRHELVTELKSKVVICLLSLLEGGIENSQTIFREMTDSLDLATVKNNMETIYKENLDHLNTKNVFVKLECGFLYCILVMTLIPALDPDQSAMFLYNNDAFKYFQSHTGQIEIVMNYGEKQLTRVLFPIPEICQYLRDETKSRFLWNVKRDSPSAKIEDFVQQSEMIIYEIENQAHVAHSKYLSILTEYSSFWWESAYGISILLNTILMIYPNYLIPDEENSTQLLMTVLRYLLSIIHLLLWLLLTAEFYFIQLPVLINRRLQEVSDDKFILMFILEHFKRFKLLFVTMTETRFLYHVVMVIFSCIGLIYNPGFYSIHLLDFVFRDSILQGVISSITLNIHSISRTAILGIIVIYIHSIIAYMYFRKEFDDSKGLFCGSLMECFITVLSHGVRSGGGIGDILEPDELNRPSGWRTVFEMSFYLVVVVFLLNAIFGIIFDTFGHLRDERSSIQQDMKNSCFICSIPAVEFQRHAKKGFEDHVKNDHNIWQYLFFLVHLRNKDPTEYTGPESYVAGCLKDVDYSFFPINRALGLDKEEDGTERLDKLEELNQSLLEKILKLEDHLEKLNDHQSRSRQNSLLLSPM